MALFKVLHHYKDLELKRELQVGEKVEMTVKRADYVNNNNKNKVQFLERIVEDKPEKEE